MYTHITNSLYYPTLEAHELVEIETAAVVARENAAEMKVKLEARNTAVQQTILQVKDREEKMVEDLTLQLTTLKNISDKQVSCN